MRKSFTYAKQLQSQKVAKNLIFMLKHRMHGAIMCGDNCFMATLQRISMFCQMPKTFTHTTSTLRQHSTFYRDWALCHMWQLSVFVSVSEQPTASLLSPSTLGSVPRPGPAVQINPPDKYQTLGLARHGTQCTYFLQLGPIYTFHFHTNIRKTKVIRHCWYIQTCEWRLYINA